MIAKRYFAVTGVVAIPEYLRPTSWATLTQRRKGWRYISVVRTFCDLCVFMPGVPETVASVLS